MSTPPDINTTAYKRVKSAWTKRRIWNTKWGVLPGMSWKHEQPFEETLREELGDDPRSEGAGRVNGNRSEIAEQPKEGLSGPIVQQEHASGGVAHDAMETNGDGTRKLNPRPHSFKPPRPQRSGSRGLDHLGQQEPPEKSSTFVGGEPTIHLSSRIHMTTPQGAVNLPALPSLGSSAGAVLHSQTNQNHQTSSLRP